MNRLIPESGITSLNICDEGSQWDYGSSWYIPSQTINTPSQWKEIWSGKIFMNNIRNYSNLDLERRFRKHNKKERTLTPASLSKRTLEHWQRWRWDVILPIVFQRQIYQGSEGQKILWTYMFVQSTQSMGKISPPRYQSLRLITRLFLHTQSITNMNHMYRLHCVIPPHDLVTGYLAASETKIHICPLCVYDLYRLPIYFWSRNTAAVTIWTTAMYQVYINYVKTLTWHIHDAYVTIIRKTGSSRNGTQHVVGCECIHIEINGRQWTL